MNTIIKTVSAVLTIACLAGCKSRQERCAASFVAMEKKSLADYRKADDPTAAIAVLEAYLTNVEWSAKHGLKATSAPDLRFWAEARLPELYAIAGNAEKANAFAIRAVQDSMDTLQAMQHSATTNLMTPDMIYEAVLRWDAKIKPRWRETDAANQAAHATSPAGAEPGR